MLVRHRQLFATGIFLLDGTLLFVAWVGAWWLRFHTGWEAPLGIPPLERYLVIGAILSPLALTVLRSFRLYRSARTARLSDELFTIAQGMLVVAGLAAVASFFTRGELSRSHLALFAVLATLLLTTSRVVVRQVLRELRRHGRNLRHALIVGTGDSAREMLARIRRHPDYGLDIRGLVSVEAPQVGASVDGAPVLGSVADLPGVAERAGADLVYLALPRSEWRAEEDALDRLADSTVTVRMVPDLARAFVLNASVEDFDGMPIIMVTESPGQGWNAVLKRSFDLAASAVGLVVLSPLLAAIAAWVKLDSLGPVVYGQERVGMNGRHFTMLKFRTMRLDAEAGGAGWTVPGDPRRTRAGRILRPLSLDELPQLWNVLLGHMSLVGPRPERPVYVDQFRSSVPRYMLRHHVKAGITGWAQVNGLRGDTPLEQRIEYDLYYIRHWSLIFDLRILALTVVRVFRDASAH